MQAAVSGARTFGPEPMEAGRIYSHSSGIDSVVCGQAGSLYETLTARRGLCIRRVSRQGWPCAGARARRRGDDRRLGVREDDPVPASGRG